MQAIVAVCSDWAIGCENQLLIKNKADMQHFVRCTTPGLVIMGRKTFESFPGGALKNRNNLVITRDTTYSAPNIQTVSNIEDALQVANNYDPAQVWLIGGASLYTSMLPYCNKAYVTYHYATRVADTWFPNLDELPEWQLTEQSSEKTTPEGVVFDYRIYTRISTP